MANRNLGEARNRKNDEFYTQYETIEREMNAYLEYDENVFRNKTVLLPCDDPEWSNFTKYFAQKFDELGLKKLVSTSYAPNSKPRELDLQPTLWEMDSPLFDEEKSAANGKIFTLERDVNNDHVVNVDDLEWRYLEGDGDFQSPEVTKLRDEADIIITNPPFSLFREFLEWLDAAQKDFVIIGNMNAVTYKETFQMLKAGKVWLGASATGSDLVFRVPPGAVVAPSDREKAARLGYVGDFTRLGNACWFTTLDHGRRHQPLPLMTEADNVKFSKHKEIKGVGYVKYDNYDAIEVPFTDAIPKDYKGAMGVPISFLHKFNPDQFSIVGMSANGAVPDEMKLPHFKRHNEPYIDGQKKYQRLFIKAKSGKS